MRIIDYGYRYGTVLTDKFYAIPELSRKTNAAVQYIKLAGLDLTLSKPTAFIYIDGFSISPSENGQRSIISDTFMPALKGGSSFQSHMWINRMKNKDLITSVDIVTSTCAASIEAIKIANERLSDDAEEVIIIGGERITTETLALFSESRIDIKCGDGFAYMKLGKGNDITDIKWKYKYSQNPFHFDSDTLDNLIPEYPVDFVKLHATGSESNSNAEANLAKLGTNITYKDKIGHTQGISGLLETCMVLDDESIKGKILVVANGFGGYYGSFTLCKT